MNQGRMMLEPHYFAMKRVLITGATGGIGRACSIWLLNQGARVAMVGREMNELLKIGQDFPAQAICIQCDLTKDEEHKDMTISALETLGGLDILINAAGVMYENDLENTSPREHDYLMNINLRVVFSVSKLCHSALLKSNGCIVNISSEWGHRPQQGMISYCMSKAGVEMLTKSLALELFPIRVNVVAPGMVNTKFLNFNMRSQEVPQIKLNYIENNPLHRLARVDEVIKAIIFLSSKKAARISGQVLVVDGGINLTSSIFMHWEGLDKMNSKMVPDGVMPLTYMYHWLEKKMDRFRKPVKFEVLVKETLAKSNWSTNLADAHYKITDNYNKIEGEDNELAINALKKDENGQIYTTEHMKPARFISMPDSIGSNLNISKSLNSERTSRGTLKEFTKK